ncbi:MAG: PLP-dependent aminotransferase family protein [Ruminococcaceae bacterium]|nr:PLP-dependent aminotransferase family protein [Oscillospiraceae bacterium]
MDVSKLLAGRVTHLKASAIREIFKMVGKSDIISFAGGIPSPEVFPKEEFARISSKILTENGNAALVYGVTEGYVPLLKIVEELNKKVGVGSDIDQTVITTGAQQATDLVTRALVNDGEGIIVEEPSFIGSLNSFRSYNAKLFGAPMCDDGIDTDKVEEILKKENIKLIYTIPTFQNPTGVTLSLEKRKKLLELAKKYDCLILEDNPYGDLRFKGEDVPTIKSMDDEGRVIYVGTFSKTLAPGIRVGHVTAHKDIIDRVVVVKQVNDVHTTLLSQMIVTEYINNNDYEAQIKKGCDLYKEKCDLMLKTMDEYFPKEVKYTRPDGGIFLWCTLPENINSGVLFEKALERKVAFVPGRTCNIDIDAPSNCFRLNFSTASNEKIVEGIKILAEVIKEELNK